MRLQKPGLSIVLTALSALFIASCSQQPGSPPTFENRNASEQGAGGDWLKLSDEVERLELEGHLDSALSSLKQAVKLAHSFGEKDYRYTSSLHALAMLESDLGDYKEAQKNLEQLIALKNKYFKGEYLGMPWDLMALGDVFYRQGQYAKAVEQYQQAVSIFQISGRRLGAVPGLRKLAMALFKNDNAREAIRTFYQVLATAGVVQSTPDTAYQRNIVLEQIGQSNADRATIASKLRGYEMAFKCATEAQDVWDDLIKHEVDFKRPPAPAGRLRQIIESAKEKGPPPTYLSEVAPQVVELLENLAYQYCHMGKYSEAEVLFSRMIEVFDDVEETNKNLGQKRKEFVSAVYQSWHSCHSTTPPYLLAAEAGSDCSKEAAAMDNPYLEEFAKLKHRQDFFEQRNYLPQRYAWAVPSCQALTVLKQYQPLVEAGAGTGYWASLLKKMGVSVLAYDLLPVPSKENPWHFRADHGWTEVATGDDNIVTKHADRTLFICWPPDRDPFARNALSKYKGKTFIYIGEGPGGCNGDLDFFKLLAKDWKLVQKVEIPQWAESHDNMYVYQRK